jgi:hypothetical protein
MMQQIVFVVIAVGVVLGALFVFIDCLVSCQDDCPHSNKTTYDSYHKQLWQRIFK